MLDRFHTWVVKHGTWPRIGLLLASCMVLLGAFAIRENVLVRDAGGDYGGVPDTRPWYTPDDVAACFRAIGKNGRDLYAATQLTLDFLFPFVYGGMFCALLARLWKPALGRWLIWLPLAAGVADLCENGLLTSLACDFTGRPNGLAWVAACFTAAKFGLLTLSELGVVLGFVIWLVHPGWCKASDPSASAPLRISPPTGEAP